MKVGVTLPVFTGERDVLTGAVRRARDAGLDSVWVFDHMWPLSGGKERAVLECYTTLAYAAASTTVITVGTLVTRSTLRNPLLLAKMASTVAAIAPGRVVVAVGSGDDASRPENEAFGFPYVRGEARVGQLEETVVALKEHFAGRGPLPAGPVPSQPPPVWVGGRSPAVLRVAGRVADGWNAWGATPDEFAREAAGVRAAAGTRDVELTWAGLALTAPSDGAARAMLGSRDPSEYLVGAPRTLARLLEERAAAGCSHAIVTFPDAGQEGPYELLGEARAAMGA